jgi:sporulation protein YlmC with PRC-barrel domain
VDGPAAFTIGARARCRDGACGRVTQVVLNPVNAEVTHLIVEPEHREGLGRLVPVGWAEPHPDHVELNCTRAQFDELEIAEAVRFLPGIDGPTGYEPDDVLLWPYFGGNTTVPVVEDRLPLGEVAVQRGERVHASDGSIGEVEGLVVDRADHRVSHVLLKTGHLFGRKQVAIPITAVTSVEGGITVSMTKHEIDELPEVDIDRSGR